MFNRILIPIATLLIVGGSSTGTAFDRQATSTSRGTVSKTTTETSIATEAITPSATSGTTNEIGTQNPTGELEVGITDPNSEIGYEPDEVTSGLVADILGNPVYSETTKDILIEQIAQDFAMFRSIGAVATNTEIRKKTSRYEAEIIQSAPLRLAEVSLIDPLERKPNVETCGNYSCRLPLYHNVETDWVTLIWTFNTTPALAAYSAALAGAPNTEFRVTLDGTKLTAGPGASSLGEAFEGDFSVRFEAHGCSANVREACLSMTFPRETWFHLDLPWAAWDIGVEAWNYQSIDEHKVEFDRFGNPVIIRGEWVPSQTTKRTVTPQPVLNDFFSDTLGQTIMSSRCTSCHSLDTPQKIADHHLDFGVSAEDVYPIASAVDPSATIHGCDNCHTGGLDTSQSFDFTENRWATPPTEMDLNWGKIINEDTTNSMRNLCQRVVENLVGHAAREHHFHGDARLFWAIENGVSPPPLYEELTTASPGNFTLFLKHIDAWNDSGAPCPE